MDYLYDGSFEGLLCCVYAHYYEEAAEGIFEKEVYQQNMLRRFAYVETDGARSVRVYDAIRAKLSSETLRRVYAVYLSSEEDKEMKILRYVAMGFRVGKQINLLHADPIVFAVQQAEKKVYAERHRYLGILRFSVIAAGEAERAAGEREETLERAAGEEEETEGSVSSAESGRGEGAFSVPDRDVLYARLEPDHDVIGLMAGHFADRYKNDPFILHDLRRGKAVFAQGGRWYISPLPKDAKVTLASGEREYRKLWKQYFETIAIRERTNPRCQKQYMPVRYWKHLTEMWD